MVPRYAVGEVWLGKERVAKWVGGSMRLRGEAKELEVRIQELIEEKNLKDGLSD